MTLKKGGLLVVNRLALFRLARRGGNPKRQASVGLDVEEVFRRYRGFDGMAWPSLEGSSIRIEDGLAKQSDLSSVLQYLALIPEGGECDLIGVASGEESIWTKIGWRRLGIDVGYYDSEWSHYSIVLNEVLFGADEEMRTFSARLNDSLLFEDEKAVAELYSARKRAIAKAIDIERIESLSSFVIYAPSVALG